MTDCNEFSLMLGAFDDSELEPHEMQAVAFHLARCENCTTSLAEISSIGRELRTSSAMPDLDGFTAAVMRRVEDLPVPLGTRISRAFADLGERISTGFAMTAAVGAVAVMTALLVTPYARMVLSHEAPTQLARLNRPAAHKAPIQQAAPADENDNSDDSDGNVVAAAATDSHAVISKLESEIPSVAVWSEPKNDTTVIWLPDQSK